MYVESCNICLFVIGARHFVRCPQSSSMWLLFSLLSRVWLCDPMDCSMPDFPILHYRLEFVQIHVHWVGDAIQPSLFSCLLLFLPSIFPRFSLFQWVSSLHQVAKLLKLQHQSFQCIFRFDFLLDWLVWSPCSPRDFWESSPAPQFESINSSVHSLLYGPTFTSVHDYWKNHSFDCMDFCLQSDVFAFQYAILICHSLPSKEQASFSFMAASSSML